MGYHITPILRGEYGKFSKVQEEFEEAKDAYIQKNPLMCLVEFADLIGAIEGLAKNYNMTLEDILSMHYATKRAFEDGTRKPRN
jgi:hypothetical protein